MVWEFQNLAPSLHVPQPQEVTHPPGSERKYLLPGSRRTLLVCKNILITSHFQCYRNKSNMMNSFRKGSDASSGFFSESLSSQNGLKSPPPLGNNDFKTRKLQYPSAIKSFAVNLLTFSASGGCKHDPLPDWCRTRYCMNKLGLMSDTLLHE